MGAHHFLGQTKASRAEEYYFCAKAPSYLFVLEGSFYMGIQFPPIAFLYLLYFYICIYIFILYIGKKNY